MYLTKGFELAKRFYFLALVPIVLDLLQLGDILRRVQRFTIKFTIPSAVPSLTQVLAEPPQGTSNGFSLNMPFSHVGGTFLLLLVLSLIASTFLKGGFLGCVLAGIKGEEVNVDTFIGSAKKFFIRFLLQFLITSAAILVLAPLIFALGPVTLLLLFGIVILSFLLVFWDYIIVVEDAMLIDAAKLSLKLVRFNLGKVFSFLVPIVVLTAVFGILANVVVPISPVFAVIAIVIYAYLGTAIVFAIMSFYLESFGELDKGTY